jgi:hypothetical protein
MRRFIPILLLLGSTALSAAELPPFAEPAKAWAAGLGHGAVATAEKRDGQWKFALAGQPFAAGHAEVPAERAIFEIGSITKSAPASCSPMRCGRVSSASTIPGRSACR